MEQVRHHQNVIGPHIRRLRSASALTQEDLAARCNLVGWDISRGTLAKIEARLRCITDIELYYLSRALKMNVNDLYPSNTAQLVR